MAEEAEELEEQEESSREEEDEEEEMVRDIVLVFFCTLWTCAMFQAFQEAATKVDLYSVWSFPSRIKKNPTTTTTTEVLIQQEV